MPLAALDDPRVRKDFLDWREKVARLSGEREADNRLSAVSAMLTWAVDRGQATANYLRGFKRLYHADRSEIIWLPEHIAAFMKVAPVEMQRALIIAPAHRSTRRRSPAACRGPLTTAADQAAPGQGPAWPQTGPLIEIPCTSALRRMLDGMDRVSPLILTTKTGQSFKKRYFARLWDEAMTKAGLQSVLLPGSDDPVELHFHDLRGTAVTLLSRRDARRNRSRPSPATRSRQCTGFWNAISRARAGSLSRRSSISRTHREQSLQTNCKPAPLRRRNERENQKHDNKLAGAPGRIRTSDPQIRSLVREKSVRGDGKSCCRGDALRRDAWHTTALRQSGASKGAATTGSTHPFDTPQHPFLRLV